MKTLIIVDAQNDFMPGGALEVEDGDAIVSVINRVLPQFDLIVATQDWHPKNHSSFASNHEGKKPFEKIELNGNEQILWPDHCVQGSPGAEFHSGLHTHPVEAVFRKGIDPNIDSYSGFYDNAHKKTTGLAGYLKEKGAHELWFCGLAADICVYFTLLDALREGFGAHLLLDAVRPLNATDFEKQKSELREKGVDLTEATGLR
ncbi:MAG: bifunctional nicotinamidase/pyrazinamidase [Flavobacteriales bacterium]|nr:bifunctional nicotinamidase/pyrazinamidase [Flavobacteriales bacterium]